MEIVINIPNSLYEKIQNLTFDELDGTDACMFIRNGTPLPKGHGDLIDRDKIEYLKAIHDAKYGHISWSEAIKQIKYSTPAIIEADSEREGKG